MPSQQVLDEKSSEVQAIKEIFKEYKSVGIASLQKVRASQLQELKKSMKGQVYLRVLKNTLIKIVIGMLATIMITIGLFPSLMEPILQSGVDRILTLLGGA